MASWIKFYRVVSRFTEFFFAFFCSDCSSRAVVAGAAGVGVDADGDDDDADADAGQRRRFFALRRADDRRRPRLRRRHVSLFFCFFQISSIFFASEYEDVFNVIYRRAMRLRSKYESLSQDASKCEDVFNAIYRRGMQLRPKWESLSQDASCGEDANNFISASENKKNNASASKWFPRESHRILGLASSGALGILAIFRTFRPNCRFYVVPFVFTTQSNKTLAKPIQKANFFRWKALWKQQKKTVKLGKPASKCWMIIVFSLTKLRNCLMKL